MPLPVAPCQIFETYETCALHSLFRKRNVGYGSRTARCQLAKRVLNILRSQPEHLQESAHLLKFTECALAPTFLFRIVRHKGDAESRAGAPDGAMNANCSFICHCCFSTF